MIQRKRFSQNLFIILVSFVLFTCQKDEITPREYPRVVTHEVSDISSVGAVFHAEITYPGNGPITDHGFVWSTTQGGSLESADHKSLGPKPGKGTFTATVTHALEKGAIYYVRAYAKGNEYLVYGKEVTFESRGSRAPEIHDFSPKTGTVGDTIVLRGAGFSFINYSNIVKLDTLPAYLIEAADTAVKAVIPQGLKTKSASVSVTVTGNTTIAEDKFQLSSPDLIQFTPKTGKAGDTITIKGKHFSHFPLENIAIFNDEMAQTLSANKEELRVLVPSGLENPVKLSVSVAGQSASFAGEFIYIKPQLTTFSPDSATYGDTITLYGEYFNKSSEISIKFGTEYNHAKAEIIEVTDDEIKVKVPLERLGKQVQIAVNISGVELKYPKTFDYLSPVINEIVPSEITFSDTVIIKGNNFHPTDYGNYVYFDKTSARVIKGSSNEIWVEVPVQIEAPDGNVAVRIRVNESETKKNITLAPPVITDFYPKEVQSLTDQVTIVGKNFNPEAYRNYVYLGAPSYKLDIIRSAHNEIVVNVGSIVKDPLVTQDLTSFLFVKTGGQVARANKLLNFQYEGMWTQRNNFPGQGREDAISFVIDGKAYMGLGVQRINNPDLWDGYNDFWEYDPASEQWTQKAGFPGASRADAEAFQLEGKGYVGLGYFSGTSYEVFVDFWEYDPVINAWTQKENFPGEPRLQPVGFPIENKVYVGGGKSLGNNGDKTYKDFWEYNPQIDQWHQKKDIDAIDTLVTELNRFTTYYITSYTAQDRAYCLIAISSHRKQFEYNQELDQWILMGDHPISDIAEPTVFVVNNRAYFYRLESNELNYYDIPANTWRNVSYRGSRCLGPIGFGIGDKGYIGWGKLWRESRYQTDLWEYDSSR